MWIQNTTGGKKGSFCVSIKDKRGATSAWSLCLSEVLPSTDEKSFRPRNLNGETNWQDHRLSAFFRKSVITHILLSVICDKFFIIVRAHLPEEEVAETHLSGGTDEQIRIGRIIAVQALTEQRLRNIAEHNNKTGMQTY